MGYTYTLQDHHSGHNVGKYATLCAAQAHSRTLWDEQARMCDIIVHERESGDFHLHVCYKHTSLGVCTCTTCKEG